jgi:hypothetical protein
MCVIKKATFSSYNYFSFTTCSRSELEKSSIDEMEHMFQPPSSSLLHN